MSDRGGLFFVGFVVGALAGAAAALLLTPYSGEEMRDQIMEKGIQLKDEAEQRAAQMAEDARSQAQQLQDRGRIVLSDNVKKAQQAVQAAQAKLEKPEAGPTEALPT